ncbi:MAG: protein phosphatase CheZ [Proteobacteria bacterium]|nr:protein phosphatase CheZ [Pseudomonadota bacterium]
MAVRKSARRKARPAKARKPVRAKAAKAKKPARKPLRRKPVVRKTAARKPALRKPARAVPVPGIAVGVEHLARIIAEAKRDLAALSAQDIRSKHLPTAGDELTAIVGATERATNAILDAVERIEKSASLAGGEPARAILADVTAIYEACNFQDITGQRISKIVSVLKEVDATVAGLLESLNLPAVVLNAGASAGAAKTGEAALLNGPQMPDAAPNQADIDALFDKA